jgi:hypothetical protein
MVGATVKPINSPAQVLFASLIGTTIEFFDFYIYATTWPASSARRSRRTPPRISPTYGLQYVGCHLSSAALLSLAGLLAISKTKDAIL